MSLEDTAHAMFSTVPEVLAGLVAMLAAFVLFRIGGLQRRIERLGEGVLAAAGLPAEVASRVETAFAEHKRHTIHGELNRLAPLVDDARRAGFDRARDRLDTALVFRKQLIQALTLSLWVNTGAIGVAVLFLAATQGLLAIGPAMVYAAIGVVVVGMGASLATNSRVLYRLLG